MSKFCEKCGQPIREGEVFCMNCVGGIKKSSALKGGNIIENHEVFTFKGRHSSLWVKLFNFFPFFIGLLAIALGIFSLIPETLEWTLPSNTLPMGILAIGLIFIILISRQVKKLNLLILSVGVVFITLSSALVFSEYSVTILTIGISLTAFILIIPVVRQVKRFPLWALGFAALILALGGALTFPTFQVLILASGCILLGIIIILTRF